MTSRLRSPKMVVPTLVRRGLLTTGLAAGAVALAAPFIANRDAMVLNITGWGGRWGQVFDEHVKPLFERETGAELRRDTAIPFVPKLQASSRENPIYDVLHANNSEQWAAVEMGLVEQDLPQDRIPNMADLYRYAKNDKVAGVVMFTSAIGLGYRRDLVPEQPQSWADMWLEDYSDRRGAYVIPINSLGQAWLTMIARIFGSDAYDIDAACDALEELNPVRLVDFTGAMERMLLQGEISLGVIHDSGVYRNMSANPSLDFASPREGALALEQVLNVTKGSQKKELAYAYIDMMLSPEIQKLMSEAVWYSPSNMGVTLDSEYQERLLTTPERVASLVQVDWQWYNSNKDNIDARVSRIFGS